MIYYDLNNAEDVWPSSAEAPYMVVDGAGRQIGVTSERSHLPHFRDCRVIDRQTGKEVYPCKFEAGT